MAEENKVGWFQSQGTWRVCDLNSNSRFFFYLLRFLCWDDWWCMMLMWYQRNGSWCVKFMVMVIAAVSSSIVKVKLVMFGWLFACTSSPYLTYQACGRLAGVRDIFLRKGKGSRFWSTCAFHSAEMGLSWSEVLTPFQQPFESLTMSIVCFTSRSFSEFWFTGT